jgi:hypothetical protein
VSGGASATAAGVQETVLRGQAVLLSEVFAARGLRVDAGPVADQVVLQAEDGSVVPLVPDEASRALWLDPRLRRRPLEVRGRRFDGLPYLQVTSLKVEHEGRYRTPEYFCDVCTISARYPQVCPCCQGSMELRIRPHEP